MMSLNGREMNGNGSRNPKEGFDDEKLLRFVYETFKEDGQYFRADMAQKFGVSEKTIDRWRKERGLLINVVEGGRKIIITGKAIMKFAANHPQLVARAMRFSRMTEKEVQKILNLARKKADMGDTHLEVCQFIAGITDRTRETIRTIVKNHDQQHPEHAIFDRTKKTVNQVRYEQIKEKKITFVPSDEFDEPDADEKILGDMPEPEHPIRLKKAPEDFPAYLRAMYDYPILEKPQEAHLFRKYNYLKCKALPLQEALNPDAPNRRMLNRIESLLHEAENVKNYIVASNLRLVVAVMKEYVSPHNNLFSLISDGNMSLMKAVEKFDYSRGNKFSTYATWALRNNRNRDHPNEIKYRDRFRSATSIDLNGVVSGRSDEYTEETKQQNIKSIVGKTMNKLNNREMDIIARRFGLTGEKEPQTLQEIGDEFEVSKERVRQIEKKAMEKMRNAMTRMKDKEFREILDEIRSLPLQSDGRKRRSATPASAKNGK